MNVRPYATGQPGESSLLQLLVRPLTILALACLGLGWVAYMAALRRLPLSVAYPTFLGAGALLVTLGAPLFFGETLRLPQVAGVLLLVVALILIGRG